jgi:hypothetical protein
MAVVWSSIAPRGLVSSLCELGNRISCTQGAVAPGCSTMVYAPTGSELSLASVRVMISSSLSVAVLSIAGMV